MYEINYMVHDIPFSAKRYFISAFKRKFSFVYWGIYIGVTIIFYLVLPSFKAWIIWFMIVTGAIFIGLFIGGYFSKKEHIKKITFDEGNNLFICQIAPKKTIRVPLNKIGRNRRNDELKLWSYGYIDEKGKLRGTNIPFEIDEWIQKIKMKNQEKPDHEWIEYIKTH